jgi:hypothetical protein
MNDVLLEGGNVFKGPDKQPLTQRIRTSEVPATIAWIEKVTGLDFTKELDPHDKKPVKWLGTTGRKEDPDGTFELNSSGDLDLSVDANEVDKKEFGTDELKNILDNMENLMKKENDGVAIAAPQIGILKRIFIIHESAFEKEAK